MDKSISFSDWLVVSDVDGTLNNKLRRMPARNRKAIELFAGGYGGHFTLASARNVQSLRKHYFALPVRKTPAIVLNGSGIYDFGREEMLDFRTISQKGVEFISAVMQKFPLIELLAFTKDTIYQVRGKLFSAPYIAADNLAHHRCKSVEEIPDKEWGKVMFMGPPLSIAKVKKFIAGHDETQSTFLTTSAVSIDMMPAGVHKGTAVHRLAQMLNVEKEKVGAIGDYYNDLDMLKSVFLPAACGQAPEKVKKSAKYHACHCNKGAVGDFLEYIMRTYAK